MAASKASRIKGRWGQGWMLGGLLGAVSLVALALMLPIWLEMVAKLDQMRTAHRDNVVWTITQLEVEYLEFEKATLRLELDGVQGLRELHRRFNVLYSRIGTLQQSPLYRSAIADAGESANLQRLADGVEQMLPLIDGPEDQLLQNRGVLLDQLTELRGAARRTVGNANFVLNARTEAAREDAAELVGRLGVASVVLFGGLMGLALMFSRLYVIYKRRAHDNLLTSQRLSTVVSTSPDAIIVVDAEGLIRDFNPAAEMLLGYDRADALGMSLSRMILTEHGQTVSLPLKLQNFFRKRMTGQIRDGRSVPLEVSQGVTSLEKQRVYVYFLRDIAERLQAEEALKASRDKALAGERAKAHFLAVMSHEMRTPLNGILGVIELMRGGVRSQKDKHYLSLLEQSGQVLLEHVNEVLDITEIEARGIKLHPAPFHLDALLREVVASQQPAASARGNQLRLTFSPERLGHFNGDAMRIRQIVANLLSNAIKFTENGEIELMVSAIPGVRGTALEIQVSDTGIGIEESRVNEVFDDFVRLGRGPETQVEGTGLGLGIVRRIVSAMGGQIGVDSIKGEGSLFWVRLTLTPARGTDVRPDSEPQATDLPESNAQPQTVLLIEDNATNRFVLRELLELDGHTVVEAENGLVGAEIAQSRFFDTILMDINMPVMGGLEATGLIRSGGACKNSRIIALTAHVLEQDAPLYRDVGIDRVLSKPISRRNLQRVLKGDRQAPEPGRRGVTLDPLVLEQLSKGLPSDRAAELLSGMIAEGDTFIEGLADLVSAGPAVVLDRVHAFSGACAMIGAVRLRNTLSRFETELRKRPQTDLTMWTDPLRTLWRETRSELTRFSETSLARSNKPPVGGSDG